MPENRISQQEIEQLRIRRDEALRAAARSADRVVAEMAREVLNRKISLHEALSRGAYAEALLGRLGRHTRALTNPEPVHQEQPAPAPIRELDEETFENVTYLR